MALKKLLAGHWERQNVELFDLSGQSLGLHPQDVWVDQQEVDMSPTEEAMILAYWKTGEHDLVKPQPMSMQQEHDLLINQGADAVKAARADYQAKLGAWNAEHVPLVEDWRAKETVHNATIVKN